MSGGRSEFKNILGRIVFERPVLLRNIIIFPIAGDDRGNGGGGIGSLHRALREKSIEVSDTGSVDGIHVLNGSSMMILGIDGQEVIGGLQNRVLNFDLLLQPRSERIVSALCVEKGRWNGGSSRFTDGRIAYPTLRTVIARTTHLKRSTLQGEVWRTIDESFKRLKSFSATSSMADLYASFEDDLGDAAESVPYEENQTGSAALIAGRFLCIDAFRDSSLYREYHPILSESYCMDALLTGGAPIQWDMLSSLPGMLEKNIDSSVVRSKAPGASGHDIHLVSETFQGSALIHENEMVHLSAFMELA